MLENDELTTSRGLSIALFGDEQSAHPPVTQASQGFGLAHQASAAILADCRARKSAFPEPCGFFNQALCCLAQFLRFPRRSFSELLVGSDIC